MRRPARGRRSSTGWLRRRHNWPGAERASLLTVWGAEGLHLDRPLTVDRDVPLRHVPRAEPLTRDGRAANPVDLIEAAGPPHQVVDVLGQEAGDALLDQLGSGAGP